MFPQKIKTNSKLRKAPENADGKDGGQDEILVCRLSFCRSSKNELQPFPRVSYNVGFFNARLGGSAKNNTAVLPNVTAFRCLYKVIKNIAKLILCFGSFSVKNIKRGKK